MKPYAMQTDTSTHEELFKKGNLRYFIRFVGREMLVSQVDMQWSFKDADTLEDLSHLFCEHEMQLVSALLPDGTAMLCDFCVIDTKLHPDPKATAAYLAGGNCPKDSIPALFVRDFLRHAGRDLSGTSYSEREQLFDTPLMNAAYFGKPMRAMYVNVSNIDDMLRKNAVDGLYAIDAGAPMAELFGEDRPVNESVLDLRRKQPRIPTVAYAASTLGGKTVKRLWLKQRHPYTGAWLSVGSVEVSSRKDRNTLTKACRKLCIPTFERGTIEPMVEHEYKHLDKGLVVLAAAEGRNRESLELKAPRFVGLLEEAGLDACIAKEID